MDQLGITGRLLCTRPPYDDTVPRKRSQSVSVSAITISVSHSPQQQHNRSSRVMSSREIAGAGIVVAEGSQQDTTRTCIGGVLVFHLVDQRFAGGGGELLLLLPTAAASAALTVDAARGLCHCKAQAVCQTRPRDHTQMTEDAWPVIAYRRVSGPVGSSVAF